jgi:hypothetical protein
MPQVKRYVCLNLGNKDNFAPKGVGDTNLIEDVWISACAVTNNDVGGRDDSPPRLLSWASRPRSSVTLQKRENCGKMAAHAKPDRKDFAAMLCQLVGSVPEC